MLGLSTGQWGLILQMLAAVSFLPTVIGEDNLQALDRTLTVARRLVAMVAAPLLLYGPAVSVSFALLVITLSLFVIIPLRVAGTLSKVVVAGIIGSAIALFYLLFITIHIEILRFRSNAASQCSERRKFTVWLVLFVAFGGIVCLNVWLAKLVFTWLVSRYLLEAALHVLAISIFIYIVISPRMRRLAVRLTPSIDRLYSTLLYPLVVIPTTVVLATLRSTVAISIRLPIDIALWSVSNLQRKRAVQTLALMAFLAGLALQLSA